KSINAVTIDTGEPSKCLVEAFPSHALDRVAPQALHAANHPHTHLQLYAIIDRSSRDAIEFDSRDPHDPNALASCSLPKSRSCRRARLGRINTQPIDLPGRRQAQVGLEENAGTSGRLGRRQNQTTRANGRYAENEGVPRECASLPERVGFGRVE